MESAQPRTSHHHHRVTGTRDQGSSPGTRHQGPGDQGTRGPGDQGAGARGAGARGAGTRSGSDPTFLTILLPFQNAGNTRSPHPGNRATGNRGGGPAPPRGGGRAYIYLHERHFWFDFGTGLCTTDLSDICAAWWGKTAASLHLGVRSTPCPAPGPIVRTVRGYRCSERPGRGHGAAPPPPVAGPLVNQFLTLHVTFGTWGKIFPTEGYI